MRDGKIITDIHTHTTFSIDAKSTMEEMVKQAEELGVDYLGFSDHENVEAKYFGFLREDGTAIWQLDRDGYFAAARKVQKESKNVKILVGVELGFSDKQIVKDEYFSVLEKYKPDFVVNSVHFYSDLEEYYNGAPFVGRTREQAYHNYLARIIESANAPYHYDILAHLGYCARYAPYPEKDFRDGEFDDELTELFNILIGKGKILEINTAAYGLKTDFLPYRYVIEKYYSMGGRKVSFGSDAHSTSRLCDGRDKVVAVLKEIGFQYLTVPFCGKELKIEI